MNAGIIITGSAYAWMPCKAAQNAMGAPAKSRIPGILKFVFLRPFQKIIPITLVIMVDVKMKLK